MDKINFENLPSTNTPLNASNLNLLQTNVDNGKVNKTINVETAGTSLNNYEDDGAWFFNRTNTPTNKPEGVSVNNGYLIAVKRNSNEVLQEWIEGENNQIWLRQKSAGTWGDWIKVQVGEVYGNAENDISTNGNLNNYTTPGIYKCPNSTTAGTISNSPVTNVGYKLIVECTSGDNRYRQTIYANRISGDLTFVRHYNGSWGNWYKYNMTQV